MAGKPISTVVVKSNTFSQIAEGLDQILKIRQEGQEFEAAAMEEVIQAIEKDKPDLRLSTLNDKLGEGLKGFSKSEII